MGGEFVSLPSGRLEGVWRGSVGVGGIYIVRCNPFALVVQPICTSSATLLHSPGLKLEWKLQHLHVMVERGWIVVAEALEDAGNLLLLLLA